MWILVWQNVQLALIFASILTGIIIANILFGLYDNIGQKQEPFEWRRLVKGLLKGLVVIVGTLCLVVCFTLLPQIVEVWQLNIEPDLLEAISVILIFAIYIYAIVQYAKEALGKLRAILGVSDSKETEANDAKQAATERTTYDDYDDLKDMAK